MSEHQLQGLTMGTSWNASCITDSDTADILQAEIEAALNEVDLAMSTYKAESEISRFNLHHQGIKFSAPSFYVISVALDIARKSAGLFDPTVMPLVNLWG
ncbi:MAG: FAD:protein FMN transferase, partial [Planctomycetota bacterium]|nr:FAD:protein FMN transferase [Planctomycetota bacterium]